MLILTGNIVGMEPGTRVYSSLLCIISARMFFTKHFDEKCLLHTTFLLLLVLVSLDKRSILRQLISHSFRKAIFALALGILCTLNSRVPTPVVVLQLFTIHLGIVNTETYTHSNKNTFHKQ